MSSLLPIATTLLAALLSIEPLHIGGYAALTASFTLMAAYHWTICRPDLLPAVALFVIGTVEDLLAGGLPGETAVTLLLCRALLLRHRHYFAGRQFAITWAGFAVVTCGAALFSWALNSLLFGHFLDSAKPLLDAILTVSVFPIVSFLLSRSQLALIKAD